MSLIYDMDDGDYIIQTSDSMGMDSDGICFEGREEHVWMELKGFEGFQVGDSVSFGAEVYRYLKTGNGKSIDFGLRNPQQIKKIEAYELPSDDDLLRQEINLMVCEACYLNENCNRLSCVFAKRKKKAHAKSNTVK